MPYVNNTAAATPLHAITLHSLAVAVDCQVQHAVMHELHMPNFMHPTR